MHLLPAMKFSGITLEKEAPFSVSSGYAQKYECAGEKLPL